MISVCAQRLDEPTRTALVSAGVEHPQHGASAAYSAPYSFRKPRPTDTATMIPMMISAGTTGPRQVVRCDATAFDPSAARERPVYFNQGIRLTREVDSQILPSPQIRPAAVRAATMATRA